MKRTVTALVLGVMAAAPAAAVAATPGGAPPSSAAFAALNPVTTLNASTFVLYLGSLAALRPRVMATIHTEARWIAQYRAAWRYLRARKGLQTVMVVGFLGSFFGLLCTARARDARTRGRRNRWLGIAAFAIGGGAIWLMHFAAMLGLTSTVLASDATVNALFARMKATVLNQPRRKRRNRSARLSIISSVAKMTCV